MIETTYTILLSQYYWLSFQAKIYYYFRLKPDISTPYCKNVSPKGPVQCNLDQNNPVFKMADYGELGFSWNTC